MAQFQGRVFRDYMLDDEESWRVPEQHSPPLQARISEHSPPQSRTSQHSPPQVRISQHSPPESRTSHRSPTHSRTSDRADTPQTVVLDYDGPEKETSHNHIDEEADGHIEYGIARTTPDEIVREKVPLHPGYGLARTIEESYIDDSSSSTSDDAEPVEPTLDSAQVEPPTTNCVADGATTAMPPEVPRKRSHSSRQPMSPISERSTLHSIKPTSPPARFGDRNAEAMEHKMPEFFSMSVFQIALYNPTISHQLLKFGRSRLCGENMEFLARVHRYQSTINSLSREIVELHDEFVAPSATSQINVPESVRVRTTQETKGAVNSTVPALEDLFRYAQIDIENLVYNDVYPKFVRHQMTLSAAKALGGDRKQYAGLGDCFVLTDPNKADNPIVFASDGFVSVTGFPRNEIIPRNCRFLQGRNTHQTSVKRLRKKIERHEETVELLLNYKKNGEPFWNLLYMTPLFDSNGKLIFFLGGQINCSTTVHTSSDVLRILAQSKDSGEEETLRLETPQAAKPPRARRMLSVFRTNSSSNIKQQSPGMENKLLNKIEDMPLKSQMDTFYTAYSNYLVVNYSTFLITFISTGLLDLLFPIKAARSSTFAPPNSQITPAAMAVGTDVFRFLANHGTGSSSRFSSGDVSWDFKSTIKSALKLGNPVSVEMRLCARPLMGFERFVLHWTPLKDEKGAVHWVVLTLGNEQRA